MIDEKSHETILIYEISYKTLEKSHETILIYEISYKPLTGSKSLRNRFDKKDGFIKVYDGSKYLVLLGPEKYDAICNRNRYLISLKCSITYIFSYYFAKKRVDSYDYLAIENVIILIKWVLNKDTNRYYCKVF